MAKAYEVTQGPAVVQRDLAKEYDQLTQDREPYLRRARDCALVTLPYLMPPSGHSGDQDFPTPNQSIGAQGLNNLANQLLNSLFPPQAPFFRLNVDDATLAELAGDPAARAQVEERLSSIERIGKGRIDKMFPRAAALYALKQLINSGNALVVLGKDDATRVHRLDNYVVRRDGSGNLIKVITRYEVHLSVLPQAVQEACAKVGPVQGESTAREGNVAVYTLYERQGKRMITWQQVKGIRIEGSEGSWPVDKAPVMALRWSWGDNEDYGRGYIEEYLGDLEASDGLSRAIREATAASAKVVVMVHPSGVTSARDVTEAESLDVITGRQEDVGMLQLSKHADMQVAQGVLRDILQRLSQAFVMHLGVRRDAERVTAEETRMVIMALEGALGGTYALLAQELQLPLVRLVLSRLEQEGKIGKLDMSAEGGPEVMPQITTGVEALGRGEDFNRYSQFVATLLQAIGTEMTFRHLNVSDFIKRMGTSLSIDMNGLVKTQEQIAEEEEQARQMQQEQLMQQTMAGAAQKAAPAAAKAAMEAQ